MQGIRGAHEQARGNLRPGQHRQAERVCRQSTQQPSAGRAAPWLGCGRGVYTDEGISGAKGRDKRPALDAMLNDASRRKFDVVMARAIDRVGRLLFQVTGAFAEFDAQ